MSAHRSTSRWWGRCEAEKTRYSSLKPISGVYFLGFDVDQVLGMMLYPHTLSRLRFPSAVGVLFGDETPVYRFVVARSPNYLGGLSGRPEVK